MAGQRLSWAQREHQLLDVAATIARTEGADALTLARVAEEAGVTKPITYKHFETRVGLLKALYLRIDEQQALAAQASLDAEAGTLADCALLLARSYVTCVLHIGREFGPITAALAATADLDEIVREGRERYADAFLVALRRFVALPDDSSRPVLLGVIGAAEILSREVVASRMDEEAATIALTRIILGAVRS